MRPNGTTWTCVDTLRVTCFLINGSCSSIAPLVKPLLIAPHPPVIFQRGSRNVVGSATYSGFMDRPGVDFDVVPNLYLHV